MRALSVACFVTAVLLVCIIGPGASGAQQLKYVGAGGCGNIVVYGWTEDHKEALIVRADREQLGLHAGANTVIIKADRKGLDVAVELYENPQPHLPEYYCNDVRVPEWERPSTRLTAVSGSLRITLGAPGAVTVEGKPPGVYEATVTLHGVTFQRPDGTRVPPGPPITLKAIVGYVLG
jgi:hypothetical protein